jgi:hypothetical protein
MTAQADVEWTAKRLYRNGVSVDALTSGNALLKHVKHESTFSSQNGVYISTPLSNGQGIGTTAAGAYANRVGNKGVRYVVPQRTLRYFGELSDDVVKNAQYGTDESQLIDAVANDIDGATEAFGQELNEALYRSNNGVRAFATFSTTVATLTDAAGNLTPEAVTLFEPGMRVVAGDPAAAFALRDSGDFVTITKVDPIAGTITADAAWSNIAGITNLDGLLRQDTLNAYLDGLNGWAPAVPTTFLGVDQTVAPGRISGTYVDVSSYGVREGFIRGFAKFKLALGNNFDAKAPIFMNPLDVAEIESSIEGIRVVDGEMPSKYNVGIKTKTVLGYTLAEDRHCPIGNAYLVPADAFTLGTAGPMADLFKPAGDRFTYSPTTGLLAFTILTLGNCYSERVAQLGHLKLSTRSL